MNRINKLLISSGGKSIALVRECSSFLEIGKGLLGSAEPEDTHGLFGGVLLRIPAYRQRFSGLEKTRSTRGRPDEKSTCACSRPPRESGSSLRPR